MKVVVGGETIGLGTTEAQPSIGIVDYSRRETDKFGVTRVVERGFARRMSVRMQLPTDDVDALQRTLAGLRATAVEWIADDELESLSFVGFYKDFSIDLALPPTSFCTLTVEGLAETSLVADGGEDPAPDQAVSTLQLLQPAAINDGVLTASSVAENDYPAWAVGTTYPSGGRVIRNHRRWESLIVANIGHEPSDGSAEWLDIGPTNRWAMFDEALGTATTSAGNIVLTFDPAQAVDALALLDVTAALVRVQAAGYDRAKAPVGTMVTFLDLPDVSGVITVTIAGSNVAVGTLLMGNLVGLGLTEASPTAEITDYSIKEADAFGEITVVERAWAKRMNGRALLRTGAVDVVANRMAAVRARPCLWIADADLEALNIYGFFKEFSIEVGENVSSLSLSVEGLSKAAVVEPLATSTLVVVYRNSTPAPAIPAFDTGEIPPGWTLAPQALAQGEYRWSTQAQFLAGKQQTAWTAPVRVGGVSWTEIVDDDPDQPKPADGADVTGDNTSKDTEAVRGRPAQEVLNDLDLNGQNWFDMGALASTNHAMMLARTTLAGQPIGTVVANLQAQQTQDNEAIVETLALMGAKSGDGQSWLMNVDTVRVGPVGGTGPTQSLAQRFNSISASLGANSGAINDLRSIVVDASGGVTAKAVLGTTVDSNGRRLISGMVMTNNGTLARLEFLFNAYNFLTPSGASIFSYSDPSIGGDGKVRMKDIVVDSIEIGSRFSLNGGQVTTASSAVTGVGTTFLKILQTSVTLTKPGLIYAICTVAQSFPSGDNTWNMRLRINYQEVFPGGGMKTQDVVCLSGALALPAGTYDVDIIWAAPNSVSCSARTLYTQVNY